MARLSPILPMHRAAEAALDRWGAPAAGPTAGPTAGQSPGQTPAHQAGEPIDFVQAYAPLELEYAVIRKSAGLVDSPQRSVVEVTGADRLAFLNRMMTQELKEWTLGAGLWRSARSFWLSRKGRIDADVRLLNLPDRVLIDADACAVGRLLQTLGDYVIADDVTLRDLTAALHRLELHGPGAAAALASVAARSLGGAPVGEIAPGGVSQVEIAGHSVIVERFDLTGEIGLHLTTPVQGAQAVYRALLALAAHNAPGHSGPNPRPLLRPIGWQAVNMARVEAGQAQYLIDFGPDTLPAETGLLDDRVSFTKGCYLGQEIVARMRSLGHPKRRLVCVRLEAQGDADVPLLPEAGAPVLVAPAAGDDADGQWVAAGAVTSATISPMLGRRPIALAMVGWAQVRDGLPVRVPALGSSDEPALLDGRIRTDLASLTRP
ncbi:MAG: hypothetical protein C0475_05455 [Planctomyces sp.]|nr:hypothetical protein [Planctomyces sp.]